MPDVGDILDIEDLVPEEPEVAEDDVERHIALGVTDVGMAVDRRSADIHAHLTLDERGKLFLPAGERIRDPERHGRSPISSRALSRPLWVTSAPLSHFATSLIRSPSSSSRIRDDDRPSISTCSTT